MTENREGRDGERAAGSNALNGFIEERVAPLARMFSETPLMSLRVETPEGTVTFEKAARLRTDLERSAFADRGEASRTMPAQRHHRQRHDGIMPEPELGQPYDTINADIVGVFHPAPDMPMPGEAVEDGQLLGFIEALKLQNPVLNARRGTFVAQIAEDGQAVDFGEALFVIDHREAGARSQPEISALASEAVDSYRPSAETAAPAAAAAEEAEPLEPPRL